jgi:hypothetical protein
MISVCVLGKSGVHWIVIVVPKSRCFPSLSAGVIASYWQGSGGPDRVSIAYHAVFTDFTLFRIFQEEA